jgi:hypothetical protein
MSEHSERQQRQLRAATFDAARAADDGRIPVVISSDAVVDVIDGPEILVHDRAAIDLARAPLPIIATHKGGQVNVGIVEDLEIGGGVLRGMARFGTRAEAAGYAEDVRNQIIRSVSVGYARIRSVERTDGVLVTQRWMPTHAALVAEPADVNAGFYREAATLPEFEVVRESPAQAVPAPSLETTIMTEKVADIKVEDQAAAERLRITAIENLCRDYAVPTETRDSWRDQGIGITEATRLTLDMIAERSRADKPVTHIDLTPKEVREYSLMRAMNAVLNKDWKKAGFELECHREVAKRTNKNTGENSFLVPMEIQKRDLTVGTAANGGYLVETVNQGFTTSCCTYSTI